jgi:hypothetical protein
MESTMPNLSDVRNALRSFGETVSVAEANKLLLEIGHVAALADLDPALYATVINAANGEHPNGRAVPKTINETKIFAKWNAPKRAPRDSAGRITPSGGGHDT